MISVRTLRPTWALLAVLGVMVMVPSVSANVYQLRTSVDFSYYLGNCFLDLIRGNNIKYVLPSPSIFQNDIEYSKVFQGFKPIITGYVGYLVCFILGLLFVILMPLVALFFCCCRCCGRCGGAARPMDSRHAKCKRVFFTICLALLNTIMLAGVVLAFINNQLFHETFINSNEDLNGLKQINSSFHEAEMGMKDLALAIKNTSDTAFPDESDSLRMVINETLQETQDRFIEKSQPGDMIVRINSTVWDVRLMENFKTDSATYKKKTSKLTATLNDRRSNLTNTLITKCPPTDVKQCENLKERATKLVLNYDISKVETLNPQHVIDKILENKVGIEKMMKFNGSLYSLSEHYRNMVSTVIDDLIKEVLNPRVQKDATKRFEDEVNSLIKEVRRFGQWFTRSLYTEKVFRDNTIEKTIIQYDEYRMYIFMGLCCLLLLIVLFYYLGLCFGMCGERPFEDASLCNRGVGANLLMAGVAFAFLFSGLLMLITMVLFLFGGVSQTEFCRYATGRYPKGPAVLDDMLKNVLERYNYRDEWFAEGYVTAEGLLVRCETEPLVDSFNLPGKALGMNDVFKAVKPYIDEMRTELSSTNYIVLKLNAYNETVSNVTKIPELTGVDLVRSIKETSLTVTKIEDIHGFIKDLKILRMNELKPTITYLESTVVPTQNIQSIMNKQFTVLAAFEAKTDFLLKAIQAYNKGVRGNHTEVVETGTANLEVKLRKELESYITSILSNVKCTRLRLAAKKVVDAVCFTFLNPFNGIWYGIGACLVLFIPTIIFAVKLAGLYRKTEKYSADFEEPDYMSYQGFYINPGDNIPLERYNSYKKVVDGYTPLPVVQT